MNEMNEYKETATEAVETIMCIKNMLVSIGGPLNDNSLRFNKDQLKFLSKIKVVLEEFIYEHYCYDCGRII